MGVEPKHKQGFSIYNRTKTALKEI